MRTHYFYLFGPHDLRLEQEDIEPGQLGPNELICETLYSAVSPGTELAAYMGLPPLRPIAKVYPRYLGYMNVARVMHAGEDAAAVLPTGTLVYTHAAHRDTLKITSDRVIAELPSGHDPRLASPAYLYRLAWNALRRGRFRSGHTVSVIGLGAIGLAAVQLVRKFGGDCIAVSGHETALDIARMAGALSLSRTDAIAHHLDDTARAGGVSDVTVTTTSGWDDWQLSLSLTRFNGTICVLGFPGRGEPQPDENPLGSKFFYDRQLTISASGFGPEKPGTGEEDPAVLKTDMAQILEWIRDGALTPDLLIGETVRAADFPDACEQMANRRSHPGTIVLDWTAFRGNE